MSNTRKVFGYHLIMDLYGCSDEKLDSIEEGYKYLDTVPRLIGTDRQGPPYVVRTDAIKYPDKAGISGWIPVVDSGISLHTVVPTKFVSIDVYTCKEFDPDKIKDFTIKFFNPQKIEEKFFFRGEEYFT